MTRPLPVPTLMLVTDRHRSRTPLVEAVRAAVAAGVDLVQLREPDLTNEEVRSLAIELLGLIGPDRLVVNGRRALALELGIGLHLREDQPIPDRPAGHEDDRALLGRSFHGQPTGNQPDRRLSYLLAGNIFETRTHPGRSPRGLGWLRDVVRWSDVPVLAIGGITSANVAAVMASGCHGVALVDAILADTDPGAAAEKFRVALDRCVTNGTGRNSEAPRSEGAGRP